MMFLVPQAFPNRYLQKSRVHRLKPLVGAIHKLPLLNSWRCLIEVGIRDRLKESVTI